jgi:hypothetical protein
MIRIVRRPMTKSSARASVFRERIDAAIGTIWTARYEEVAERLDKLTREFVGSSPFRAGASAGSLRDERLAFSRAIADVRLLAAHTAGRAFKECDGVYVARTRLGFANLGDEAMSVGTHARYCRSVGKVDLAIQRAEAVLKKIESAGGSAKRTVSEEMVSVLRKLATRLALPRRPCRCGLLREVCGDPEHPVRFDRTYNEFHLVRPRGYTVIRHCPFCGDPLPASRRARAFRTVSVAEQRRLKQRYGALATIEEIVAALGPPDRDAPDGLVTQKTLKPGARRLADRLLTYCGLSKTAYVIFAIARNGRAQLTWLPKAN